MGWYTANEMARLGNIQVSPVNRARFISLPPMPEQREGSFSVGGAAWQTYAPPVMPVSQWRPPGPWTPRPGVAMERF